MKKIAKSKTVKKLPRPPIVAVLGHVDHGKTTLLDSIRKTRVQMREAGGITQGIGASSIVTKGGNKITFIDTPGHAAFSDMRSRGASVSDIAILIVAANDGVKPQTREALDYIKAVDVPYIVVASKIDLPSGSVENVKKGLESEGVKFEADGGDVPLLEVSAKTGKGIDELLETITLLSEINEISKDPNSLLDAYVIETRKDKRGPLISVVLKNGNLKVGDEVVSAGISTKIRAIFDSDLKSVKSIEAGGAGQIMGFKDLPAIGSKVILASDPTSTSVETNVGGIKVEEISEETKISIVVKAKNQGSLEALVSNLPEGVRVLSASVGDVNESDVFLAKSLENPHIFVFESNVSTGIQKLASTEGVRIEKFEIIYKLFEKLEEIIIASEDQVLGEAEILDSFPYNKKTVAGVKVKKGRINRSDRPVLCRGDEEIGRVRIISMKKGKIDTQNAKEGEELGIIFVPQLDFQVGDVLKSTKS